MSLLLFSVYLLILFIFFTNFHYKYSQYSAKDAFSLVGSTASALSFDDFYTHPECMLEPFSGYHFAAIQTRNLSQSCGIVVYTTLFYEEGHHIAKLKKRLKFRTNSDAIKVCYFIFTNEFTGNVLEEQTKHSFRLWNIIKVPEPLYFSEWNSKNSRIPKLLPGLFFPQVPYTIFVDWKLQQNIHPWAAVQETLLQTNSSFVVWNHPSIYLAKRNKTARDWMQTEVELLLKKRGKIRRKDVLKGQMKRYLETKDRSIDYYAEGGILYRETNHEFTKLLDCEWFREYSQRNSSGRDQLAFAFVLAKQCPECFSHGFRILSGCTNTLCHYRQKEGVSYSFIGH